MTEDYFELAMKDADDESLETLEAGERIYDELTMATISMVIVVDAAEKWQIYDQIKDLLEHVGAEVKQFHCT